jgi:hypothetical protein
MENLNNMTLKARLTFHKKEVLNIRKPQYKISAHKLIDMGKYKIKNKIIFEPDMFYSEAFNVLSRSGIVTLMRCLQKRKWDYKKVHRKKERVYLNEEFIFPYAEACFLGIGTTQYWKNMNKLIEVGFIDITYQGGWYQKHKQEKDYSRYKLSERWRKYGTAEFENFEKQKVLPEHFYIRENIARQKSKTTSLKRSEHLHESEDDRPKSENVRLHESEVDKTNKEIPESLVNSG